jgi:hypothetical protein
VSQAVLLRGFAAGAVANPDADRDGADMAHGLGHHDETVGQSVPLDIALFSNHTEIVTYGGRQWRVASGESQERGNAETNNARALQEFFVGMELAVFAGVMERDVGVGAFIAVIDFAHVEGLGVNVNADGALIVFGKI